MDDAASVPLAFCPCSKIEIIRMTIRSAQYVGKDEERARKLYQLNIDDKVRVDYLTSDEGKRAIEQLFKDNPEMLLISGLKPNTLKAFQTQIEQNHGPKTLYFGDVKTAVAKENGVIQYEVVYIEMKDITLNIDIYLAIDILFLMTLSKVFMSLYVML